MIYIKVYAIESWQYLLIKPNIPKANNLQWRDKDTVKI